jgi:hypothetical protein
MSFDQVLRTHQRINALARSLLGRPAFDDVSVLLPDPASPEPAFLRATSWLYCLYFEAGRVSLTFLQRLGEAYSLSARDVADTHVEAVRSLRTELHHNLGFADSDLTARTVAENWRRRACGTSLPQSPEQWKACYERIVVDSAAFLERLDLVVRRIESDGELARHHLDEWQRRLTRSWAAAAFDPLIDDAKRRLARTALNTVAFRNRYVDRWRKHLETLEDGFDFDFEVTRLIEMALLSEDAIVLPITGRDVIEVLRIRPGPEIALLLVEARRHFEENGGTREDILAHLRDYRVASCAKGT